MWSYREKNLNSVTKISGGKNKMSFCKKCGAELKEGTKFCSKCGEKVSSEPVRKQQIVNNTVSNNKNTGSPKLIAIGLVVILVVIAAIVGISLKSDKENDFEVYENNMDDSSDIYEEEEIKDKELENIDIFDYVEVEFSGTSPNIYSELKVIDNDYIIKSDLKLDKKRGLADGDIVTVTYRGNEDDFEKLGYKVNELSKEYIVEGTTKYATTPLDIKQSELEKLQQVVMDYINSEIEKDKNDYNFSDLEYEGLVVMTNNNMYKSNKRNNEVLIVYSATVSGENVDGVKVYYPYAFYNVVLDSDGNIDYSRTENLFTSKSTSFSCDGYEDANEMFDYNVKRINGFSYEVSNELVDIID